MDNYAKGRLLVAIQFLLLGALVVISSPDIFQANAIVDSIGGTLEVIGFVIVIFGFLGLGKSLTANPVPLKQAKLVTTGIYNKVRHPIYLGLLIATFGITLINGSQVKFVFWVLLVALLSLKIKFEEQLLVAAYPQYRDYQNRVPGLIPNIFNKS